MQGILRSLFLVGLLGSINSCVTVQDALFCTVAGEMSAGANCSHLISSDTEKKTFDQFMDFLDASPSKGSAICISAEDLKVMKTELEQMCRMLKKRCSYQVQKIVGMQ